MNKPRRTPRATHSTRELHTRDSNSRAPELTAIRKEANLRMPELSLPKFELAVWNIGKSAPNRTSDGGVAVVIVNTRSNARPCMADVKRRRKRSRGLGGSQENLRGTGGFTVCYDAATGLALIL